MKSSNTQVMVEAYRLLSKKLEEGEFKAYPLHLGVTEAGEGEDGRIKSAVGIGTLLEDGLGDTIRVSLTEDPELEIPVAQEMVRRLQNRSSKSSPIIAFKGKTDQFDSPIHPFYYERRQSNEILNFGGKQVPRVIADFSSIADLSMDDLKSIGHFYLPEPDKWAMNDLGADYIFTGDQHVNFMLPNGLRQIQSSSVWMSHQENSIYPQFSWDEWCASTSKHPTANFIKLNAASLIGDLGILDKLKSEKNVIIILHSYNEHKMPEIRRAFFDLMDHAILIPVIIHLEYEEVTDEQLQIYAPTDAGALLIDGLGDGIMISSSGVKNTHALRNSISFGTLQASRVRISKTEYISCPSCGRTLFDLQETTAKIRKVTDHLKGIKIGIMGCIVNGPGEMADADYGYVGTGKDKIALYKGQNVIKKSVPAHLAVDELIQLIKDHGDWKDAPEN